MIALIQRVLSAHVDVDGETLGTIGAGLLALVAACCKGCWVIAYSRIPPDA